MHSSSVHASLLSVRLRRTFNLLSFRPTVGNESRLENAAWGAGSEGGAAGAVPKVLRMTLGGGLVKPIPEAQELMRRGVTPTPGQAAGPGIVRGLEERVAGFPLVGEPIQAARRRAVQQYSKAAIGQMLDPLHVDKATRSRVLSADNPLEAARDLIGESYERALSGVNIPLHVGDYMQTRAQAIVNRPLPAGGPARQPVAVRHQQNSRRLQQGPD